jgi:hypothetical protein
MRPGLRRALAVVCLVTLLSVLVLHYSAAGATHVTTLSSREKVVSPAAHVGDSVYFWTRADTVAAGTMTVTVAGTRLTVVDVGADVDPGDVVQVAGTIRPGATVAADQVVVSPRERRSRLYGVSVLGLLLAVGGFLRAWTVDVTDAGFVPRGGEDA